MDPVEGATINKNKDTDGDKPTGLGIQPLVASSEKATGQKEGPGDTDVLLSIPKQPTQKNKQDDSLLASITSEHAANTAPADLSSGVSLLSSDVSLLSLEGERNIDEIPSQVVGVDDEAKSVEENLNTLPLVTVDQNETASNEVMSSKGRTQVNGERLVNDNKDTNDISTSSENPYAATHSNIDRHLQSKYQLKKIGWLRDNACIVTQNENGPCPLIAVVNVLLLKGEILIPSSMREISDGVLLEYVAQCIMDKVPKYHNPIYQVNYEQNVQDALSVLPRLVTGLDVNVKFTGVRDFEYTPECIIFDLLNISLYHGWLVDPQSEDVVIAVGELGYNQLVEKIIRDKFCDDSVSVSHALTAEMFLENTASQLTYHGLCELYAAMASFEVGVFFRNNHFSTLLKYQASELMNGTTGYIQHTRSTKKILQDGLFQLVTDQGFLNEPQAVWEALLNIEGDTTFVDGRYFDSSNQFGQGPFAFMSPGQQFNYNLELAHSIQQGFQQETSTVPSRSPSTKHLRSPDRKKKESGCTVL